MPSKTQNGIENNARNRRVVSCWLRLLMMRSSRGEQVFSSDASDVPEGEAAVLEQLGPLHLNEVQRAMVAARAANLRHGTNQHAKKVVAPIGASTSSDGQSAVTTTISQNQAAE